MRPNMLNSPAIRSVLIILFAIFLSQPAMASKVRVTVNGTQITDQEISLRAALIKLERRGNSNNARLKLARDELIEEALKLQEAKRLKIEITEKQVDAAYLNVARNLRMSVNNLNQILKANGVSRKTLRDRLRAGIAWQQITKMAIMPRVQISDLELNQKAEQQLEETMSYDYILKEILFIIPKGSNISKSRRTAQANQYRKNFNGCDGAVKLSLSYRDVAVLDVGRRHATQLPKPIAKELARLDVGGITKPRVVEKGVSMLAICTKNSARDLTFIKNNLRQEVGNEKVKKEADAYLQRLKERATIIIH